MVIIVLLHALDIEMKKKQMKDSNFCLRETSNYILFPVPFFFTLVFFFFSGKFVSVYFFLYNCVVA